MRAYGKIGAVGILIVVCMFLIGAVRYNLSVVTSAIADLPPIIIIDAGHGGEDGGTTGLNGASESMLNLEIALRLEQLLSFCGYDTLMIRRTDTAIYTGNCETLSEKKVSDLKNRVALINQTQPGILISIHQNHFSEEKYSGAQVFYAKTDSSRELAETVRSALNTRRPCKPADSVYLMEKIECPGVLIECGFLSNSREEALLVTPEYQKKLVGAITGALSQFTAKDDWNREV